MPTFSIDIEARFAKVEEALKRIEADTGRTAKRLENSFTAAGRSIGLGLSALGAGFTFKAIIDAGIQAERSAAKLAATLRATGFAAGQTTQQIERMVAALADQTAFDDEEIRDAATALLRFRNVQGDVYQRALKLTLDLAVAQGSDGANAAEKLGRALENPLAGMRALTAVMPPLTESTKQTIKRLQETGDIAGAQRIVLDELAKSIGGTAGAENAGLYGSSRAMGKAWDDMLEAMAKSPAVRGPVVATFNAIAEAARLLGDAVEDVASGFNKFDDDLLDKLAGTGRYANLPPGRLPDDDPEAAEAAGKQSRKTAGTDPVAQRLEQLRRELQGVQNLSEQERVLEDLQLGRLGKVTDKQKQALLVAARAIDQMREDKTLRESQERADKILEEEAEARERNTEALETAAIARRNATDAQRDALIEQRNAWLDLIDPVGAVQRQIAAFDTAQAKLGLEGLTEEQEKLVRTFLALEQVDARYQGPAEDFLRALDPARQYRQELERIKVLEAEGRLTPVEAEAASRKVQRKIDTADRDLEHIRDMVDPTRDLRRELEIVQEKFNKGLITPEQAAKARAIIERDILETLAYAGDRAAQTQLIMEDALVDPLEDFITKAKSADDAAKAFFDTIARSLLRLQLEQFSKELFSGLFNTSAGGGDKSIFSLAFSGLTGLFGGGAATAAAGGGMSNADWFANGGVMTARGPLKLERYATGGVAMRPQLALFGEGRRPEAYVPLPDGRTIPVTLRGGSNVQAGPSAVTQRQRVANPNVTLQLHPAAMQMTLRDWLEGEMARTLATR